MSRTTLIKKTISEDGSAVTFVDANDPSNSRVWGITDFAESVQIRFAQHGMSQKGGDQYSGLKTVAECFEQLDAIHAQLVRGDWRAAGESAGPKAGKTVRALFRMIGRGGKLANRIGELLGVGFAGLAKEMKSTITGSKEVKAELATMAAEEAAAEGGSLMG